MHLCLICHVGVTIHTIERISDNEAVQPQHVDNSSAFKVHLTCVSLYVATQATLQICHLVHLVYEYILAWHLSHLTY